MSTLTQFLPQQGSVIKSIQRGTFTILNGSSTGSIGISAVDLNKAVLNYLGAGESGIYVVLSSSTLVEGIRPSTANTRTVSIEVVEYN